MCYVSLKIPKSTLMERMHNWNLIFALSLLEECVVLGQMKLRVQDNRQMIPRTSTD